MNFLNQFKQKNDSPLILLMAQNDRVKVQELIPRDEFEHHQRGVVGGFSKYSKKRLLEFFHSFKICPFKTFWTLTFAHDVKSSFAKHEIDRMSKIFARRKLQFLWVMEFTKRGRIHFHLALTGEMNKKLVAGLWGNGFVYVSPVFEDSGLRRYFVSEVSKGNQKRFHGFHGRWWGLSRALNKQYSLGVYNDSLVVDLAFSSGYKRNYFRDDFEKLGLDFNDCNKAPF